MRRSRTTARSQAGPSTAATRAAHASRRSRRSRATTSIALEVAWTFHTGDVLDGSTTRGKSAFQSTPALLGDTLYVCSPKNRVFALDPESGTQKWVFDPGIQTEGVWNFTCRGVAAWNDPSAREGQQCASRIFTGTVDGRLFALDATTGRPCIAFGDAGGIDLTRGMQPIERGEYGVTSPPTVIGDVVAVGGLVWDGQRTEHAPGVVRGFDARTGDLVWFWDPVPPGTPPLPKTANGEPRFHHGTPNAWSIFSVDAARDLLIFGTGNAGPGLLRRRAQGPRLLLVVGHRAARRYGRARLALPDRAPRSVGLRRRRAAVADRRPEGRRDDPRRRAGHEDGTRLRAAPRDGRAGVAGRGTPGRSGRRARRDLRADAALPHAPEAAAPREAHGRRRVRLRALGRNACRDAIAGLRSDGMFTPPSREGSIQYPGVAGGINWGSIAFDPQRRLLVTTQARIASEVTLVARDAPEAKAPQRPFDPCSRRAAPRGSRANASSPRPARPSRSRARPRRGARCSRSISTAARSAGKSRSAPRAAWRRGRSGSRSACRAWAVRS